MTVFPRGWTVVVEDSYTRPATTTQYAAGDQVSDSASAPAALEFEAARFEGGTGVILDALCISSANQATKPNLRLYLFDTEPTPNNDNAAWAPSDADMLNLIGVVEFSAWEVGTSTAGAGGNCASLVKGLNLAFKAVAGSQTIYGLLVERGTYTPVSAELLTVRMGVLQD